MKYAELMDSLFFDTDIKMQDMQKGLTNQNFLLTLQGQTFVLRVPKVDTAHIIDRHHEALALNAIKHADLDVETVYFDEISGYKVSKYIEHARTYHECTLVNKIELVAALMRRFHALHVKTNIPFAPLQRLQQFQSHIRQPLYDLREFRDLEAAVASMTYDTCLCHNDFVDGNLLFVDQKVYLIDYEYAADNDPLFDVMSFLTENNISDKQQRQRFYDVYFDTCNDVTLQHLTIWEYFHHYLWCHWAMMLYESRQEQIYATIAKEKYDALRKRPI